MAHKQTLPSADVVTSGVWQAETNMATATTFTSIETLESNSLDPSERLKRLYPSVNESETPLPRAWSPKDKFNFIGLSLNNLRVHYKGKQ